MKFLTKQNLPFRGNREDGYSSNFVIILDCMPDISHSDQMSFIFHLSICCCWRQRSGSTGIISWFYHWKIAYDIKKMILDWLEKEKLYFKKFRGIGFDNAANMTGVHGGIQHLLWNINGKTKFMPCSNYCLNLWGAYVSSVNVRAITFFWVTETLYTFFSSFNQR